ncbi:MAG: T9SS type A sorting domain-containing protein [Bacteroidota bacterium]|nr:T9SS type A sorting domain-containing protein [Bacteroidota bacterium]MDP4253700.1 T9SS type A sorting domain-containing protein [Bacteroidota bacterium]MDP4259984.1 T9SS type A sorting domain-containing protein [Bacteroidota bacterium]
MNPVYSIIRMVEVGNAGRGILVFPNPANDHINLVFNGGGAGSGGSGGSAAGSWQVDVLSVDGRLLQRERISNTNEARLQFSHLLAAGVYFLRAINTAMPSENYHAAFEGR